MVYDLSLFERTNLQKKRATAPPAGAPADDPRTRSRTEYSWEVFVSLAPVGLQWGFAFFVSTHTKVIESVVSECITTIAICMAKLENRKPGLLCLFFFASRARLNLVVDWIVIVVVWTDLLWCIFCLFLSVYEISLLTNKWYCLL